MSRDKNITVTEELHTRIKIRASQEKKSIKDFITETIEEKLEEL